MASDAYLLNNQLSALSKRPKFTSDTKAQHEALYLEMNYASASEARGRGDRTMFLRKIFPFLVITKATDLFLNISLPQQPVLLSIRKISAS